jgi:hypothetical protein
MTTKKAALKMKPSPQTLLVAVEKNAPLWDTVLDGSYYSADTMQEMEEILLGDGSESEQDIYEVVMTKKWISSRPTITIKAL